MPVKKELKNSGITVVTGWGLLTLLAACLVLASSPAAAQYSCLPPPDGLVSWWPGDGNADDLAGANPGVLVGGTSFAPGMVDEGFSFDGMDSYVEVPHNGSLNRPEFSVEAWLFIDPAANAGELNVLVSKSDGSSAGGGFALTHDDRNIGGLGQTQNGLRFMVFSGPGWISEAFLQDAFPGPDFYHVAGTFDGSVARLYLNGAFLDAGPVTGGVLFNSLSLRIGASHTKEVYGIDDRFQGVIDEVGLFARALPADEIQAIFDAGGAGKCKEQDSDGDGVADNLDVCPDTRIPESVPTKHLKVNRFALVDGDRVFDTRRPPGGGGGPAVRFTIDDTGGCSCEQIIDALDLGKGHTKFGCSLGAMEDWVDLVNP